MKRLSLLLSSILISGCSVIMAATPSGPQDLSVLKQGARKADVERALGKPIKFHRSTNGDFAIYQYFTGDKSNYKRAATYAVLDGLTLGVAELFTAPMEALQGDRNEVHVYYSRSGRVKSYKQFHYKAPLPPPEKIMGVEEWYQVPQT